LGRAKFKVKEIYVENRREEVKVDPRLLKEESSSEEDSSDQSEYEEDDEEVRIIYSVGQQEEGEKLQCRLCWGDEVTTENPLISCCQCRGGVQFIHVACLKMWIRTKRQEKDLGSLITYQWKSFECELCKTSYPYYLRSGNSKFDLVELDQVPQGPYMVLESLHYDKETQRQIHILKPSPLKNSYQVGRGHDADIRISDISVSRNHATIKFNGDGFFVQDAKSKFGTLVKIKKSFLLRPYESTAIQIGRSVIHFSTKPMPAPVQKGPGMLKQLVSLGDKTDEQKKLYMNMQLAEEYI